VWIVALLAASVSYWAFEPVADPSPPETSSAWVRTPVDAFVLETLHREGLTPSAELERERLVRRVYLDLTGLGPTPEQARAFIDDDSPRAYERLVEQLLASPHYGERWALKWLDVVRYSDTNGFELDGFRQDAWRYRDYVVESFNADKPYDRFVREQVAGDELYPGDAAALIATGFNGAGPRHVVGGNQDPEEARQEVLTEMTIGVGQVFLGLTVHCARCHDHKFDPIKQTDYYQLQAFFSGSEIAERNLARVQELNAYEAALQAHEERLKPIREAIKKIEEPYRAMIEAEKRAALAPEFAAALSKPERLRSDDEARMAEEAADQIKVAWYETVARIPEDLKIERKALREQMHAIDLERPEPPAGAYSLANLEEPEPTHVLKIGDYRHPQQQVEPGYLSALDDYGAAPPPKTAAGRRAALARWLTEDEHPLTARVMANRVWEFRMGRGLVADPNNFGLLGGGASHPELLDYLARYFVESGWSVKALDRMILLSSAYRQSAAIDPAKAEKDPDNQFYWRADRRRLEAEMIRDNILAASGRLEREIGGRPVRVPIEQEVYDLIFTEAEPDNLWPVTPDESQHRRRSLYLLNRRTVRLPMLANFDQPDTMTSCAVRPSSTHALQALSMLNSEFVQAEAAAFAERIEATCGQDAACAVERGYAWTLARAPDDDESASAQAFLKEGELTDFCLALLNRNEFVYRP